MLCYVKTTQNQNEAISSLLQYDHIVWKDCFVVFTGSWFPNIMLCPNLMKMKMEGTAFSWRIRAAEKYSSTKKLLLSKSPQNTRSAIKCCYLCKKKKKKKKKIGYNNSFPESVTNDVVFELYHCMKRYSYYYVFVAEKY